MHPRRIPTFIGLGLVLLGLVFVLVPYRSRSTVTIGFESTSYSMQCQAPLVDLVTSDPPQRWTQSDTGEPVAAMSTYPSPCHSERAWRGLAAAVLVAAGITVWIVARRRQVGRPDPAASAEPALTT